MKDFKTRILSADYKKRFRQLIAAGICIFAIGGGTSAVLLHTVDAQAFTGMQQIRGNENLNQTMPGGNGGQGGNTLPDGNGQSGGNTLPDGNNQQGGNALPGGNDSSAGSGGNDFGYRNGRGYGGRGFGNGGTPQGNADFTAPDNGQNADAPGINTPPSDNSQSSGTDNSQKNAPDNSQKNASDSAQNKDTDNSRNAGSGSTQKDGAPGTGTVMPAVMNTTAATGNTNTTAATGNTMPEAGEETGAGFVGSMQAAAMNRGGMGAGGREMNGFGGRMNRAGFLQRVLGNANVSIASKIAVLATTILGIIWAILTWLTIVFYVFRTSVFSNMNRVLWTVLAAVGHVFALIAFFIVRSFVKERCENCESWQEAGAEYCTSCGSQMRTSCPNCGASVSWKDAWCASCGTSLKKKETV